MSERDAQSSGPAVDPQPQPDDSPMGRLRKLREESRSTTKLTLPVPKYDGILGVTYKSMPRDELRKLTERSQKDDLDLLIHLCEQIAVRGEDGEWEPLTHGEHEIPVKFDQNLADYLGFELETERKARECVEKLFSSDLFPLAPSRHVKAVVGWMEGEDVSADERLLGE